MTCAQCDGTGWRATEQDGVRRVQRCECWRDGLASKFTEDAKIPLRYARCDLEHFVVYPNEKLVKALAEATRFAVNFPAVQKGLCLIGPPGIGKTHIAVAVLRKVIAEKNAHGLFYDVPDLLRLIRSTYNPVTRAAEADILQPVMHAELLVLDDLGKERPTEWVEEMMNMIVSTRYNECRPTIFTSNYNTVEDDTDLDSLKVRVGFRLYSRLFEMCEFLEFDGADYRLVPPNSGPDELLTFWKHAPARRTLPARTRGVARAQYSESALLRESDAKVRREIESRKDPRELKWPGGKAGRN